MPLLASKTSLFDTLFEVVRNVLNTDEVETLEILGRRIDPGEGSMANELLELGEGIDLLDKDEQRDCRHQQEAMTSHRQVCAAFADDWITKRKKVMPTLSTFP